MWTVHVVDSDLSVLDCNVYVAFGVHCDFLCWYMVFNQDEHTSFVPFPSMHSVGLVASHHEPEVVSEV